jgi:hypothetical protein
VQNQKRKPVIAATIPLRIEDVPEGTICRRRGAECCFMVKWRGRDKQQRLYVGASFEQRVPLDECDRVLVHEMFLDQDDVIVQMAEGDFVVSRCRDEEPFFPGSTIIERVEGAVVYRWRMRKATRYEWAAARLALAFSGFVCSVPSAEIDYEKDDDFYAF